MPDGTGSALSRNLTTMVAVAAATATAMASHPLALGSYRCHAFTQQRWWAATEAPPAVAAAAQYAEVVSPPLPVHNTHKATARGEETAEALHCVFPSRREAPRLCLQPRNWQPTRHCR